MQDLKGLLATATYQEAAWKILEELENRGFTSDDPDKVEGLFDKITNIIKSTIEGNSNYSVGVDPAVEKTDRCECRCIPTETEIEEIRKELGKEQGCQCRCHEPDGWEGDLTNQA